MNAIEYLERHSAKISQDSERLFIEDFLYPLLGSKIENIVPQYPFVDSIEYNNIFSFR